MDKNLHIIFPKDETTDFLEEIVSHINLNVNVSTKLYRLYEVEEHTTFRDKAQQNIQINDIIIFLGHGQSTALSGACSRVYSFGKFISESELSIFKDRKVFLLSCRSTEYLKNFGKECGLKGGIGFPNLVTDFYETLYSEESERVDGISEADVERFKKVLVNIVKYSLEDFINYNLSFHQLFTRMKLRTQKLIIEHYSSNPKNGKTPYGKMLYDLNDGLYLIGN